MEQNRDTAIDARTMIETFEGLFSSNQIGVKAFELLLLFNQSTGFSITKFGRGEFQCDYLVRDPWSMFDPGRQISFRVQSEPASFRLSDENDEQPAAVICGVVNKIKAEGSRLNLMGYALLEGSSLMVHNHVDLVRTEINLPDTLRIEALNYLSAATPHCFDLSQYCSVTQNQSPYINNSSYSLLFKLTDDIRLHALVTSKGEFVPESESTPKVLNWMRAHLDHHVIGSVGINQASIRLSNWPFEGNY
jgi:hypothetical protein